jgi:ATP-dependent helicase/nuclease subunit B
MPPAEVAGAGAEISVSGKVDRVDGWVHDGKLYLRIIDYKTGKKSFSLSDIWYGMGMQMLIYLFVLKKSGAAAMKKR